MIKFLKLLFDGKKPVDVTASVQAIRVEPQRQIVAQHLRDIDRSLKKIDKEAKRMKKKIDTALAIAIATGGIDDNK